MAEPNPFILRSEHNRILGAAQQRYDEKVRDARKIGYWQGIACLISVFPLALLFFGVAAFNLGLYYSQFM